MDRTEQKETQGITIMSEQFRDDIHRDDFKLRILLTNNCNLGCSYCLNDFQSAVRRGAFLTSPALIELVSSYVEFCKEHNIKSEIYFSGGEPSIHPHFEDWARLIAAHDPDRFVLCTNGSKFLDKPEYIPRTESSVFTCFDEIHVSIHRNLDPCAFVSSVVEYLATVQWVQFQLPDQQTTRLKELVFNGVFGLLKDLPWGLHPEQFEMVYRLLTTEKTIVSNNSCWFDAPFKLKVWANYWNRKNPNYMEEYAKFIDEHPYILNRGKTFEPKNRGSFCKDCQKDCITLKGLWVFPDNTCYPCPQFRGKRWPLIVDAQHSYSKMCLEQAYDSHRVLAIQ